MKFIKHPDLLISAERINLEKITTYYPSDSSSHATTYYKHEETFLTPEIRVEKIEEFSINFSMEMADEEPFSWRFSSKFERDACLKQIDDLVLNK